MLNDLAEATRRWTEKKKGLQRKPGNRNFTSVFLWSNLMGCGATTLTSTWVFALKPRKGWRRLQAILPFLANANIAILEICEQTKQHSPMRKPELLSARSLKVTQCKLHECGSILRARVLTILPELLRKKLHLLKTPEAIRLEALNSTLCHCCSCNCIPQCHRWTHSPS